MRKSLPFEEFYLNKSQTKTSENHELLNVLLEGFPRERSVNTMPDYRPV